MKWTDSGEFSVPWIALHAYVPHFRMQHAAQRSASQNGAAPNAGSHGDIGQGVQANSGTKTPFGQCGRVHVSVEIDRLREALAQPSSQIIVAPTEFRRG